MLAHLTLRASDGFELAATQYVGERQPRAVVLLSPATAVKRSLYRALAEFLAGRGAAALVWDWRGTGGSRPRSLRGFRATMREWAERDLAAAIDEAARRWPGLPLVVLGHSFGGQAVGLAPNAGRLDALVLVAAQSGWWGHWPAPRKYLYAMFWHLWMPAVTRLCGFYPGSRLGIGEDLPMGVALEWARWCRSPAYLGDWRGHAAVAAPLLALGFADDPYAPPAAVEALCERYGSRDQTREFPRPADVGMPRIGHFGFFRPGAEALWRRTADWIDAKVG
jgi:predicted alpha/beta hydrolase